MSPSPHTGLQTLGCPEQEYPFSIRHVLEHPSPDIKLPSSHCSFDVTMPFPHSYSEQTEGSIPMHE